MFPGVILLTFARVNWRVIRKIGVKGVQATELCDLSPEGLGALRYGTAVRAHDSGGRGGKFLWPTAPRSPGCGSRGFARQRKHPHRRTQLCDGLLHSVHAPMRVRSPRLCAAAPFTASSSCSSGKTLRQAGKPHRTARTTSSSPSR